MDEDLNNPLVWIPIILLAISIVCLVVSIVIEDHSEDDDLL